jgi:ABC-2 type transport system permease protein
MSTNQPPPLRGTQTSASGPSGSIFDLGYQAYVGPRLGRRSAVLALFLQTIRSCFGIGRGMRAKIAPFVLAGIAVLPAVLAVGFAALASQAGRSAAAIEAASPITYQSYQGIVGLLIMLFCAAQAPELFGRDQRHGVIALYFARPLRRSDYALARLAGFVLALLALLLLPQAILLVGRVLLSTDVVGAFGQDLPKIPAILGQAIVTAALLGSLAMAVSAFTPRRAYATAGIIAIFILPGIVSGIVIELGSSTIGNWLVLLSQSTVLDGTNALLFGHSLPEGLFFFNLPGWSFLASAVVATAVSVGLVVRRFSRIAT